MQEESPPPPRPPIPLRRSHLDSATCRAALRILSYCAEVESHISPSSPRLSPLHPDPSSVAVGSREQQRPAASQGAIASCGTPREGSNGFGEERDGSGREGNGERAGRGFPEDGGRGFLSAEELGLGKILDVLDLVGGCPGPADAHVENSLLEVLLAREIQDGVFDEPRNGTRQEDRPCGSSVLSDSLVGFSRPIEEFVSQKGEGERGGRDSDGFKDLLSLEDIEPLIAIEACSLVDAPGRRENSQGGIGVSPRNESLSLTTENATSMEESRMEEQLKICDSSVPSTDGSGPRELDGHHKIISVCTVGEVEMEEGEIPNEGEISDLSFGLELEHAANGVTQSTQSEHRDLANDMTEKRNTAYVVGSFTAQGVSRGMDFIKEGTNGAVCESGKRIIVEVGLKPQKKKKNDKGAKKDVKNIKKNVNLSNKPPSIEVKLEHKKKKKNAAILKDPTSENVISSSLADESTADLAIQGEEKPSNMEDVKAQQKRKRAPLTESRKEKKKLAKKRKRAETNRKLGVKRLKLETFSKPKKVIPCSFYQKGRCQKGDACKFSHDIIPDTKSMPCTFFARGTCLKGDDCPFDHQLSKYPCHNYVSQGRCNRGDDCLFSHKIHIGELSSTASVTRETDSPILSGKQSLRKCLNSGNLSSSAVSTSPKSTPRIIKSSMPKDSVDQKKVMEPMRIPKGMRFLSFGTEPSIGTDKQHHDLDLKNSGCMQMQKDAEKLMLGKPQNLKNEILLSLPEKRLACRTLTLLANEDKSTSLLQKPSLLVQPNVKINSCESVKSLGSNTASSSGSKDIIEESQVTDASRILEEFLFTGIT
uniref:Zinc finger CCCH domain-containing protein 7 n=1 Tax=Anthurium amnicola TaxID=1678845 RepID=A0A1D1YHC8_9ARAE